MITYFSKFIYFELADRYILILGRTECSLFINLDPIQNISRATQAFRHTSDPNVHRSET